MILPVVLSLLELVVSTCQQDDYAQCTYFGLQKGLCQTLYECIPCKDKGEGEWASSFGFCASYSFGKDSHDFCSIDSGELYSNTEIAHAGCPHACNMCSFESSVVAGECPDGHTKIRKHAITESDYNKNFGVSHTLKTCFSGCVSDKDPYARRKVETYLGGDFDRYGDGTFQSCAELGYDNYHFPTESPLVVKFTVGESSVWSIPLAFGHIWGRYPPAPTPAPFTPAPTADEIDTVVDVSFEFGTGCEAGEGGFTKYMGKSYDQNDIGIIPKGTRNVVITLELEDRDLDIRLFDTSRADENNEEGFPLIKWCDTEEDSTCNYGIQELVPFNGGEGSTTYTALNGEAMLIKYSGFSPNPFVESNGNEQIEIVGEVAADLRMSAFAYETGDVAVKYSWDAGTSDCCLGTERCFGSFVKYGLQEQQTAVIGEIPLGVKDVQIDLNSPDNGDLDIRLYDLSKTDDFEEGEAIVAWCDQPCNAGKLGSSDGGYKFEKLDNYDGTSNSYSYSGYNGVPHPETNAARWGTEFVNISGVTERPLVMEVFSYSAGSAVVEYSYFVVPK